jgi:polysaccharide export outer membrane protein
MKQTKNAFVLLAAFFAFGLTALAQVPLTQPTPEVVLPSGEMSKESKKEDSPVNAKPAETPAAKPLTAEEEALKKYYESLRAVEYRLGPEDVISVTIFDQPKYSRANITVPPDGRIGLPLIQEGVQVIGKTPQQVQEEVAKKLDEYIIDPKVTVTLDKAVSSRYGIIGNVQAPGAKIMTRRMTLYQAIIEAGGILSTGDKEKVVLLRFQDDTRPPQPIIFNLKAFEQGKSKQEMVYLVPGDTILVPNRGFSLKDLPQLLGTVAGFRSIAPVPGIR